MATKQKPVPVDWMVAQLDELGNLCAETASLIRDGRLSAAKVRKLYPLLKVAVDPVVVVARSAGIDVFESDWRPKKPRQPKTLKFPTSA